MASQLGVIFRVATFGESHGGGVGVVVDGCPPRLALSAEEIQRDLDRRRPGQSRLTTPRQEADRVEILSGVFEGQTLGTPIALLVRNEDARPAAYEAMKDVYRPSHADFTTEAKYGIRNWQGGGRASARETIGRVAAGASRGSCCASAAGVEVLAWVSQVHDVDAKVDAGARRRSRTVEANPVRCPDPEAAARMEERIDAARRRGDSLGGVVDVRRARRAGGARRAGLRQARGRSRQGRALAARVEGLRDRQRLRGHAPHRQRAQRPLRAGRRRPAAHRRATARAACRAASRNGEPILLRVAFKPTATIRLAAADRRPRRPRGDPRGRRPPRPLRPPARRPDGRGDGAASSSPTTGCASAPGDGVQLTNQLPPRVQLVG